MKKTNDDEVKFLWKNVKWIRVVKGEGKLLYKQTLQNSADFKYLSIIRKGFGTLHTEASTNL